MFECHKNPAEVEEIFCFDEDDQCFNSGGRGQVTEFRRSPSSKDTKVGFHDFPFDPSRLPNFENEEILSIRPRKNFSFDIMQNDEWEPSRINRSSRCFDLSSMFRTISGVGTGEDDHEEEHYNYCVSFEDMTTIEGLRVHLRSCFTCGVHWHEEQASLDCSECGGFALSRPCPDCDGKCHATWTRNLDKSHSLGKAKWIGTCTKSLTKA